VPDDDDRLRDASSAAGANWSDADEDDITWAQATAPDDISELARDIHAYRRECRAQRRRARLARYSIRRGTGGLTLAIIALALAAVAAIVLTAVRPSGDSKGPSKLPLATTTLPTGQVGGLLPSVQLTSKTGTASSSLNLRPGVLALLPAPSCHCSDVVASVAGVAATNNVGLYAIAPAYRDADADVLGGQLGAQDGILYDTHQALANAVGQAGLTLVLVNRDGTIYDIDTNVTSTVGLGSSLTKMLAQPGTGD
jgi:hypothetical protein